MQGLALAGHLGFRRIAGPALGSKALLQLLLLLSQLLAQLLQVLLLLSPGSMGARQGLHRLLQSGLFVAEGLLLITEPFQRQLPFSPGVEQGIPFAAGRFQSSIGGFQVLLQLLPGGGVVVSVAAALRRVQLSQFAAERCELLGDQLQPFLLHPAVLLQAAEPLLTLTAAFQQGAMVATGRIAFRHQGRLALFQIPQRGPLLLDRLGELGFLAPADHQRFPEFQQPPPQRFCFVLIAAATEAESAAALGEAAAGHGTALFQQFSLQRHRPGATELLAGAAEIAEHQRVPEDVRKHLVVHRLEAHQLDGATDQARSSVP